MDLASLSIGLTSVGYAHPALYTALARRAIDILPHSNPTSISALATAFASTPTDMGDGEQHGALLALFEALAHAASGQLHGFDGYASAALARAYSLAEAAEITQLQPTLFVRLAAHAKGRLNRFSPQERRTPHPALKEPPAPLKKPPTS